LISQKAKGGVRIKDEKILVEVKNILKKLDR